MIKFHKSLFAGTIIIAGAFGSLSWGNSEVKSEFAPVDLIASHQIEATSCVKPRSFRRITMKGGTKFAREGEVFAFEPRVIRAERCEEIEIVFENTDAVRHALMFPGLSPMFIMEFTGPDTRTLRFVTPDKDITLEFHCHVPSHEKMGMFGALIVGEGGSVEHREEPKTDIAELFIGIGTVVAVDHRNNRLILNHGEITGFMAAMQEMSFLVDPASLLQSVQQNDRVQFTIDAKKRMIVGLVALN